ncbi:hypothetical protein MMC20_003670 [Loxospora ochrophaea]|nr:hypothetical protein [Loxospora ochrophaea]
MATPSANTTPLHLTIRFTNSLPDLPLTISSPTTTPTIALKPLIRASLPPSLSAFPLRLIHSGALLPDSSPLTHSLRLPPQPPPPPPSTNPKGKFPAPPPLYIHCSLTTTTPLTPSDLAAESALATTQPPTSPQSHLPQQQQAPPPTLLPPPSPPLGFDRLLTASFTPAEIASLRAQFTAIQAHRHTPDTMPSPTEMRLLEDRWIDNVSGPGGGGGGGGEAGAGALAAGAGDAAWADDNDDESGSGLADMLWGNVMGFFWPVGALGWLVREEGVWSKRRVQAVVTGVVVNLVMGVLGGMS